MMSWTRFSPRGSSYRGSAPSSTYRGIRGETSYRGSRGGFSSSSRGRGGFSYKYDTTNDKYSSGISSGGRYTSQSHVEDYGSFHTKTYRPDTSSYVSSRDHSHRTESDLSRKRLRSESYSQSQGSISRRSHEAEDYRSATRYPTYSESRTTSYGESRGVYKKPRTLEYRPKEDYRRKEMPPPPPPKPRSQFRGRITRGRGGISRRGDSFLARKRSSAFSSEVRRTASELLAIRRVRILKLRSLREQAARKASSARLERKKKEAEKNAEGSEKGTKEDGKEGEKSDEKKAKKEKKKEDGEVEEEGVKSDKEEEKKKEETARTDFYGNPFLKLDCPHCHTKCVTFKEYASHLYEPTHVRAMRDKSIQLKATLAKMRVAQRTKQKKTEEEDLTSLNARTIFCPICKLNYSQDKIVHQSSEAHKKMKSFLLPYCRICRISFKSPMLYESHICSLDHIKRKHKLDIRLEKSKKGSTPGYLENFMVLDSIGSGDEAEDSKEEEGKRKEEKEEKDEQDDNLGSEFIRRVDVFYCEVCRAYLPRLSDQERVLRVHCRTKNHLRCYLKFGNDDLLRKMNETFEDKDDKECETEMKDDSKDESSDTKTKEGKNQDESVEDEVIDDKLWADVGDLLNQVEPETKSDDEEEEEGGRYDRFKSVEKKENGELPAAEGEEKLANGEVDAVPSKEEAAA